MTTDSIPQDDTPVIDTSKDKRFWLFMWHCYEADGGMFDFIGSFEAAKEATEYRSEHEWDRGMIFDSETRQNDMVLHSTKGWIKLE